MRHSDRRPDRKGAEKILRHELRHPDATGGSRVAWKITGVHSGPADDPHEIRHRRALKVGARRLRVLADVDVGNNDVIPGIDVIAILARDVVLIFLDDLEGTG